jgi:prepilin-type N-terminal cleavage/methylation domain-containing protein
MKQGFTLIELIIVVMIMSLFVGIGYSTYTKQIQAKKLDKAVNAFVDVLYQTRDRTISRDLAHGVVGCTEFGGYRVRIRITPSDPTTDNDFRQQFVCTTPSSIRGQGTWNEMDGMEFKLAADTYVTFTYPSGCTTSACTAANMVITIKNPNINTCKDVTINALGNITTSDVYDSTAGC